jgi:hypothetical protein
MLLNYNVPPWMTTKKHFIILSLIIPGKKSITGEHFDVFLQPLIEELQYGWSVGICIHDASNYCGQSLFTCRIMCVWTIYNFPALGLVAGCVTKGYVGCPCCDPNTISRRFAFLKKNCYDNQHRCWLFLDHPSRTNTTAFYGGVELGTAPQRPTAEECIAWGHLREEFVASGATPAHADLARVYGIKRIPTLLTLPYWKVKIPSNLSGYNLYCSELDLYMLICYKFSCYTKDNPSRSYSHLFEYSRKPMLCDIIHTTLLSLQ